MASGDRKVDHYIAFKEYERINRESKDNQQQRLFQTGGWKSLGPDNITNITGHYSTGLGRVEFVQVNKNNDQQIYIGSRSGGLWRTSDGGATWSHNTDFLPASGVNAIAASPTNFDNVLINVRNAGNGTSFGVYKSNDGGTTFTPTAFIPTNVGYGGLGSNVKVYTIQSHPTITVGKSSFLAQLIRYSGGLLVTENVETAFPKLSKETALALQPEAIILSESPDNQEPNEVFENSPPIKNGRVYKIHADLLSRPGPRLVDALEQIARFLHPEKFRDN